MVDWLFTHIWTYLALLIFIAIGVQAFIKYRRAQQAWAYMVQFNQGYDWATTKLLHRSLPVSYVEEELSLGAHGIPFNTGARAALLLLRHHPEVHK